MRADWMRVFNSRTKAEYSALMIAFYVIATPFFFQQAVEDLPTTLR